MSYSRDQDEANNLDKEGSGQGLCNGIYWYLTNRCNLRCRHCWISCAPDIDCTGELLESEIHNILSEIEKLRPQTVMLTGGEPLMHRSFYAILEWLQSIGVAVEIETNGTLISPKFVSVVGEAQRQGAHVGVNLSLDGATASHHDWVRGKGNFERTMAGMRLLTQANVRFDVQFIANKVNMSGAASLFELCRGMPVRSLKFGTTFIYGRASDDTERLTLSAEDICRLVTDILNECEQRQEQHVILKLVPAMIPLGLHLRIRSLDSVQIVSACSFPLLGILPDGKITVCALTADNDDALLGDVRGGSLAEAFRNPILQRLATVDLVSRLEGQCKSCSFKAACRGSCRAQAFQCSGSFYGPFPLCQSLDLTSAQSEIAGAETLGDLDQHQTGRDCLHK